MKQKKFLKALAALLVFGTLSVGAYITASAETAEPASPAITSRNVEHNEFMHLAFQVGGTGDYTGTIGIMMWEANSGEPTVSNSIYSTFTTNQDGAGNVYYSSQPIAAKNIYTLYRVAVVEKDANGKVTIISNAESISIADWAKEKLASNPDKVHERLYKNVLAYGDASSKVLGTYDQRRDDEMISESWASLEKSIAAKMDGATVTVTENGAEVEKVMSSEEAKTYAANMIAELKVLYGMYTDDLIEWFANLYEPNICACDGTNHTKYCGGAGFYYSNSARDNAGFLPDAETTAQVLGFFKSSGMLNLVDRDVSAAFPEGESEKIVRFIKSLQEENGYFIHPQWQNLWDNGTIWPSRISRDLTYSVSVLSNFGAKPTYDTPSGVEGDGILYDGTDLNAPAAASALTLPLSSSRVSAVSRVVATAAASAPNANLESLDTFKSYLARFDSGIGGDQGYSIANELSSLASQIVARDKVLGAADDSTPLTDYLVTWLKGHQNEDTGLWYDNPASANKIYTPINSLLKITALYNELGRPIENALAAARSAFAVITSGKDIEHVCDLYNTWFSVSNIVLNLKRYQNNEELANQIINEVRWNAIPAVKATAEQMKNHQKADGSFSYFRDHSSATSQGAPAAVSGQNEGDVNATVIFTCGIVDYMFSALDFSGKVPLYTDCDRQLFLSLLEERLGN